MDSADITVSVVMATYNRANFLPDALDSLLAQSRPPAEIIVVDDCSTDDTERVLDRYRDRVRIILREKNAGKPAALNLAIPLATGSHIWIFDDDDVALPDALRAHVDYLSSHPDVDFSYGGLIVYVGDGNIWDRAAWRSDQMAAFAPEEFLVRMMESMDAMIPSMLIPVRCYQQVGPFDESLHRCEDEDMLLRLARRFRAASIGERTFVYRDHDDARGPESNRHAGKERFAVQLKYRQIIYRRVRAEYPLHCYLPGHQDSDSLPEGARAHALTQRGCIMFRQGLINEGFEDFQKAMQNLPQQCLTENWLRSLLSRSVDIEPWTDHDGWGLLRRIYRVQRCTQAASLSRYVARGLYWNLNRALHKKEWRQARQSLQMLLAFSLWKSRDRILRRSAM